ncbi:glycosyltransferase [bacterium]|nr:glycosyltransferase [bacterium]
MTKPLRIAFLIGSMREGGAEGYLVGLMRGLRTRGHDVRLMLLHYEGVRLQGLLDEGFEVFPINLPKLRPVLSPSSKAEAWRALKRTRDYLKQFNPHIFHAWLFEAEAWGGLAKRMGAPGAFVTSRQNLGHYKDAAPWKQRVQNWYNKRTELVIANSQAVARDVMKREKNLDSNRVAIVYGGVDVDRFDRALPANLKTEFPPLEQADCVFVSVANYFRYKGYLDLIEAWHSIAKDHPGAHLLCVGRDDEIGEEMSQRVADLKLFGHVHIIGPRADIPNVLKAADALVLASHEEGFSGVLLEGMAAGLPIVATDVGGNAEAVENERTGLIVPPRNPQALAGAIARLAKSAELREQFGKAGYARVREKFTHEPFVTEHEALYRRVAGRSAGRRG